TGRSPHRGPERPQTMSTPRAPRPMAARTAAAAVAILAVAGAAAMLARHRAGTAPVAEAPRVGGMTVQPASFRPPQEGPGAKQDLFEGAVAWLNTAQPIRSQDLIGKVVLLDFWTYCCINCHHIIPDLEKLEQKYAN